MQQALRDPLHIPFALKKAGALEEINKVDLGRAPKMHQLILAFPCSLQFPRSLAMLTYL
jgi:hypothetical protein